MDISGCIVTIDAIGCQKEITRTIRRKGAEYVLALKGNQEHLYKTVADYFAAQDDYENESVTFEDYETSNQGHGRTECPMSLSAPAPEYLDP